MLECRTVRRFLESSMLDIEVNRSAEEVERYFDKAMLTFLSRNEGETKMITISPRNVLPSRLLALPLVVHLPGCDRRCDWAYRPVKSVETPAGTLFEFRLTRSVAL